MISHLNDCMSSQLLGIMHLHGCRGYLAGVSSSSGECRAGTRTRSLGMAGWPTSALLARQDGPYPHLAHTHTHTHSPRRGFTRSTSHIHLIPRTYTRLRALRAYHRENVARSPEKTKNSFLCRRSPSSPLPLRAVLTFALIQFLCLNKQPVTSRFDKYRTLQRWPRRLPRLLLQQ